MRREIIWMWGRNLRCTGVHCRHVESGKMMMMWDSPTGVRSAKQTETKVIPRARLESGLMDRRESCS